MSDRIVVNSHDLEAVAKLMSTAGGELKVLARNIITDPWPELPPNIAAQARTGVGRASTTLFNRSVDLEWVLTDLRRRAMWAAIAGALRPFWKGAKATRGIYGAGGIILREARFISALKDLEAATDTAGRFGRGSLQATNAWFDWESGLSRSLTRNDTYLKLASKKIALARVAYNEPDAMAGVLKTRWATVGKWGGRVAGPLMIGSSIMTMIGGSKYHGTRGEIDRWVAPGAGIGAGAVFTLVAAGVALGPGVVLAAGVIAAGIAGWQLGNLIYDYRHEIAHGIVGGSNWVWNHSVEGFVYNNRDHIKNGIVGASEWGYGKTKDAVNWATHHIPGGHRASRIAHSIGGLIS